MAEERKKRGLKRPHSGAKASSMLSLEPRIMLDAAAVATGAEVMADNADAEAAALDAASPAVQMPQDQKPDDAHDDSNLEQPYAVDSKSEDDRIELVFVDKSIGDYQSLIEGIEKDEADSSNNGRLIEVIEIEADADGILQITSALSNYNNISAVHILSHADQAELYLGNSVLNSENLDSYSDQFSSWQGALNENADLLLYGCNIAEGEVGVEFVNDLAEHTSLDVAASTDATGADHLGGDYELEYHSGTIEVTNPLTTNAMQNWQGLLDITENDIVVTKEVDLNVANPGDPLTYTITIENVGTMTIDDIDVIDVLDDNVDLLTVITTPTQGDDLYTTPGNTQLEASASRTIEPAAHTTTLLTDNDLGFSPLIATVTPFSGSTTLGGYVEIFSDGSFIYTPPTGASNTADTFTYEVTNLAMTTSSVSNVVINIVDRVWYVDADAAPGGDGSSANPFNELNGSNVASNNAGASYGDDVDAPGDYIFVHDTVAALDYAPSSGSMLIENNQTLIGDGVILEVDGLTLTTMTSATGPAINNVVYANAGDVQGITITDSFTTVQLNQTISFSNVTYDSTLSGTAGTGILFINGTSVDGSFNNITLDSGRILFQNLAAGSQVAVLGTTSVTSSTNQNAIEVNTSNNSEFDFGDTDITITAGTALNLNNNFGTIINFSDLDISGTGSGAIYFLNAGTINTELAATPTIDITLTNDGNDYGIFIQNSDGTVNNVAGSGFLFDSIMASGGLVGAYINDVNGFSVTGGNIDSNSLFGITFVNMTDTAILMQDVTVQGSGGGLGISDIVFTNVTGTVLLENVTVNHTSTNSTAAIRAYNSGLSGPMNPLYLTIQNSTIDGTGSTGSTGIFLETDAAEIFTNINNNTIQNFNIGVDIAPRGDGSIATAGTIDGTISDNNFSANANSHIRINQVLGNNIADPTYNIIGIFDNTLSGGASTAINLNLINSASIENITIAGNTIEDATTGIYTVNQQGIVNLLIDNNTINNNVNTAIYMNSSGGANIVNATISNNTLSGNLNAVDVFHANLSLNNLSLLGNTINNTFFNFSSLFSTLIDGYAGAIGDAGAFSSYVFATNTVSGSVVTSGSNILGGGTPPLPTAPSFPPPLRALDGVASNNNSETLTLAEINSVTAAAKAFWADHGVTASELAKLDNISFKVDDLSGDQLGKHSGNNITLDINAAGHGWFVDTSPTDASEYIHTIGESAYAMSATHADASKIDLLTTVIHEMGHVLGTQDVTYNAVIPNIMAGQLATGIRILPEVKPISVSSSELQHIINTAVNRWLQTGLNDAQIEILNSTSISLGELNNLKLAEHDGNHIIIDNDGGGKGWFVDQSPYGNDEFVQVSGDHFVASTTSSAAEKYDLLTVVMHELGHALNIEDVHGADHLMTSALQTGERFLPTSELFSIGSAQSGPSNIMMMLIEDLSLDPGETKTINVIVIPVDPFPFNLTDMVTNQAIVTFGGGFITQTNPADPDVITTIIPETSGLTVTKTANVDSAANGEFINYTIIIENTSDIDAVNIEVTDFLDDNLIFTSAELVPIAEDDAFDAIGNTLLEVGVTPSGTPAVKISGSLFDNDFNTTLPGVTLDLTTTDTITQQGGLVSVNPDGSFTYTPPTNFNGVDTFVYGLTDNGVNPFSTTATVSITVDEMVWYIDRDAAGGGDGRASSPFNSINKVNVAGDPDGVGDYIYLFDSASTYNLSKPLLLENNQTLIGAGVDLVVGGYNLTPMVSKPTLQNTTGDIVRVTLDNTIRGLTLGNTNATAVDSLVANPGTVTISDVDVNSNNGSAIDLNNALLDVTFDSINISNNSSSPVGIDLSNTQAGSNFTVLGDTDITVNGLSSSIYVINLNNVDESTFIFNDVNINLSNTITSRGISLTGTAANTTFTFDDINISIDKGIGFYANGVSDITTDSISVTHNGTDAPSVDIGIQLINVDNFTITGTDVSTLVGDFPFYIVNSSNISLTNLNVTATSDTLSLSHAGILALNVENFELRQSYISAPNGGYSMNTYGLSGTALFVLNYIDNADMGSTAVNITAAASETLNLGIIGNTVTNYVDDAWRIDATANNTILLDFYENTIINAATTGGLTLLASNGSIEVTARYNTFQNFSGRVVNVYAGNTLAGTVIADFQYNQFNTGTDYMGQPGEFYFTTAQTGSSLDLTFRDNTIFNVGNGVILDLNGDNTTRANIINNVFTGTTLTGIGIGATVDDSANLNWNVNDNNTGISSFSMVQTDDGGFIYLNMRDNFLPSGSFTASNNANGTIYGGANVYYTYFDPLFYIDPTSFTNRVDAFNSVSGAVTPIQNNFALFSSSLSFPTAPPLPTLPTLPTLLSAHIGENTDTPSASMLSQIELDDALLAAKAYWIETNLSTSELERLDDISISAEDLAGSALGHTRDTHITIDPNAAGHGWFVDTTPFNHSEFTQQSTYHFTNNNSQIDLLTTVIHEVGHILGKTDLGFDPSTPEIMASQLESGTRILPTINIVASSQDQHNFDAIFDAAKQHWIEHGLSSSQAATLDLLDYNVVDLHNFKLGEQNGNLISIDIDAAGKGWFIDETPLDNAEYAYIQGTGHLTSSMASDAYGKVDLLTIMMHEIGHALNIAHEPGQNLMDPALNVSERFLPSSIPHTTSQSAAFDVIHINGASIPVSTIPFLAAGDKIAIGLVAQVPTIVPVGIEIMSNQVLVTSDNTASAISNIVNTLVDADPDLVIEKISDTPFPEPGDIVVYTLDTTNIGTQHTDNVVITEFLPPFTTFVPEQSTAGWVDQGDGSFTFDIGLFNVGDVNSVDFAVKLGPEASLPLDQFFIRNTASVLDNGISGLDAFLPNNFVGDGSARFVLGNADIYARIWGDYFEAGRGDPSIPYFYDPAIQIISHHNMNDVRSNFVGTRIEYYYDEVFGQIDHYREWTRIGDVATHPAVYDTVTSATAREFPGWTPYSGDISDSQSLLDRVDRTTDDIDSTQYEYDAMNRVTRMIDSEGNETQYEYDEQGRLIREISDDKTIEYQYDANGNVTKEVQTESHDEPAPIAFQTLSNQLRHVGERFEHAQTSLANAFDKM